MSKRLAQELTLVSSTSARVVRFGVFDADLRARELRRRGVRVKMSDQPFHVLALLLERPGDVVTRDEFRQRLWPADTFVEFDLSLNSAVRKLREALGDSADHPTFVETLPRRGYRFIAPVERPPAPAAISPISMPRARPPSRWVARRWWIAAVVATGAAAALIVIGARGWWISPKTAAARSIRTIAVIPIVNEIEDPAREYVVDGLTDALITEFTQLGRVAIVSEGSSKHYKNASKLPPQIGRELDVDGVLKGTLTFSDGTRRLRAQLIVASTDWIVWTGDFDATDLAGLAAETARTVTAVIDGRRTPLSTRAPPASTVVPGAYDLYLQGLAARAGEGYENIRTAVGYFRRAIGWQPRFASALASLALAEVQLLFDGPQRPDDVLPEAQAIARKALEIDPTRQEAQLALDTIRRLSGDIAAADEDLDRLLLRQPSAELLAWQSVTLIRRGRLEDAQLAAVRAQALNPVALSGTVWYSRVLRTTGFYKTALFQLKHAESEHPENEDIPFQIGSTYALAGDITPAIAELERAVNLCPRNNPRFRAYLGYAYAMGGRTRQARQILQDLLQLRDQQYVSSFGIALIYDALGEKAAALAALKRASQEHAVEFVELDNYPPFRTLASEPLYAELMHLHAK